jgi:hypothetical protein
MRTYLQRLWAALRGAPLPSDALVIDLKVRVTYEVTQTGGPVIAGGGGPTDPGKPK